MKTLAVAGMALMMLAAPAMAAKPIKPESPCQKGEKLTEYDAFTYTISDGRGGTDTATVRIMSCQAKGQGKKK